MEQPLTADDRIPEPFELFPSCGVGHVAQATGQGWLVPGASENRSPAVELLVEISLANSKREAREFLNDGAISINGSKAETGRVLHSEDLLHGRTILMRRGKKRWHATRWE